MRNASAVLTAKRMTKSKRRKRGVNQRGKAGDWLTFGWFHRRPMRSEWMPAHSHCSLNRKQIQTAKTVHGNHENTLLL